MHVCVRFCVCVKLLHVVTLPLPGKERGLLTSSWSGLIAGQDSALIFTRLRLTDPEMERERKKCEHVYSVKTEVADEENNIISGVSLVWISSKLF